MITENELATHAAALLVAGKIRVMGITAKPGSGTIYRLTHDISGFGGELHEVDIANYSSRPEELETALAEQNEKFASEKRILLINTMAYVSHFGGLSDNIQSLILGGVETLDGVIVYGPPMTIGARVYNRMINIQV
jgi:hypothetical protein